MTDLPAAPPSQGNVTADAKTTPPAETAPAPKKKHRLLKGVLMGAFALGVAGLALDDLALRYDNFMLGTAVVVQNEALNQLHEENLALKEALGQAGLIIHGLAEENQILKEELGIEPSPEGEGEEPQIIVPRPQDNTRLIQMSSPGKPVPVRPAI